MFAFFRPFAAVLNTTSSGRAKLAASFSMNELSEATIHSFSLNHTWACEVMQDDEA